MGSPTGTHSTVYTHGSHKSKSMLQRMWSYLQWATRPTSSIQSKSPLQKQKNFVSATVFSISKLVPKHPRTLKRFSNRWPKFCARNSPTSVCTTRGTKRAQTLFSLTLFSCQLIAWVQKGEVVVVVRKMKMSAVRARKV